MATMKLLVVVANYPYAGYKFSGIFNERSVTALKQHCAALEVLVPRPYVPSWLPILRNPRWNSYSTMSRFEVRDGVPIHRPVYIRVPRVAGPLWAGVGAFLSCRRAARTLHARVGFDAILAFDLVAAGGLAWRLGRDLGVPVACWATGEAVAAEPLRRFDLVFYQSRELYEYAARATEDMPADRHIVLPRGIPEPRMPATVKSSARQRIRTAWKIRDEDIAVLYIGRVTREKGMFELLDAMAKANRRNSAIKCFVVGSAPAFDETAAVHRRVTATPELAECVHILPACPPGEIWDFLCAGDIFAFPSHHEGMPNALLEAMVMGIPSIAFGIPPVLEIGGVTDALIAIPPRDVDLLSDAIVRLASSPTERLRIGDRGRAEVLDRFMIEKNMAEALNRISGMIRRYQLRSDGLGVA